MCYNPLGQYMSDMVYFESDNLEAFYLKKKSSNLS